MKKYILPLSFIALITMSGCKLKEQAEKEYQKLKNKYEEATDIIQRGKRPFPVVFQTNEDAKTTIISSQCANNQVPKYIYFATQADATNNIFTAIKNLYSYPHQGILKPFWDSRYVNPVSEYIKGTDGSHYPNHATLTGLDARTGIRNITVGTGASQVDPAGVVLQSECINGKIVAGTTVNLNDAPSQSLTYGGIASTFIYQIHADNHIKPWKSNKTGNLMMQANFNIPIYMNFEQNIGGSISYALYFYNQRNKKHLSYIISVYAAGIAWQKEKAGIRYDPTTDIVHVATVVKDSSWWSTKSPKSDSIIEILSSPNKTTKDDGKWTHFYRVNIAYNNLLEVLKEIKRNPPEAVAGQDFGLSPQDWEVSLLAIQYELEEQGGKALFAGSFRGFEAYISNNPL